MRQLRTANRRLVLAAAAAAALAARAHAENIVVLAGDDIAVVDTESQQPVAPEAVHQITGLLLHDRITSIDTRTTTGVLYGFARDRLYTIDPATGVATLAGPRAEVDIPKASDFDPASGMLRMVGGMTRALSTDVLTARMDPVTMRLPVLDPTYAAPDSYYQELVYAPGDPGVGSLPQVTTLAHDPSASGALYGIDAVRNTLVRIGAFGVAPDSVEAQRVRTVAPLTGITDGATVSALEITREGIALAVTGGSATHRAPNRLYRIDLTTGEATVVTDFGERLISVSDLAVAPTATLPAPLALDVRRATVRAARTRLGFSSQDIDVRGSIPFLPGGFVGKALRVDVGGATREFTIFQRGRNVWSGVAGRESIRLTAVRLRGGDLRIDYVLRLRPDYGGHVLRGDGEQLMQYVPGGIGPFDSYVGFFFDQVTLFATPQFQKVAKK